MIKVEQISSGKFRLLTNKCNIKPILFWKISFLEETCKSKHMRDKLCSKIRLCFIASVMFCFFISKGEKKRYIVGQCLFFLILIFFGALSAPGSFGALTIVTFFFGNTQMRESFNSGRRHHLRLGIFDQK